MKRNPIQKPLLRQPALNLQHVHQSPKGHLGQQEGLRLALAAEKP